MPLCDTLMRIAEAGLYQIHFSQEILDGATRNLVKDGRMSPEKAARFQGFLLNTFPEALIEVPDSLASIMTNDPGDHHVLAAAVACQAESVVTFNLKHFQPEALAPWNVRAEHPDAFLSSLCELHGVQVLTDIVQKQASALKRPPVNILDLLENLHRQTPNFAVQIITNIYGKKVESIARKFLNSQLAKTLAPNRRSYTGDNYELRMNNGIINIIRKEAQKEILKLQSGNLTGFLTAEDVRRFLKAGEALEDCFKTA